MNIDNDGLVIYSLVLGSPALGTTNAVHASIALTAAPQTITTGITDPDAIRTLLVTGNAAGITGDVVVTGTDIKDQPLSETFALNGTGTIIGTSAFKTVTSFTLPVETHAGTDAVEIGLGDNLGLPAVFSYNTILSTHFGGVKESVAPTLTMNAAIDKNVLLLDSALDGSEVKIYYHL